jgi:tRNA(fMet)-specific endonuclease VapC
MALRYLLDTDTVSLALRGEGEVGAAIVEHLPSELALSAITVAELRFGADRKASRKLHRLIDAFLRPLTVLPFDLEAAARFGTIAASLADSGTPIGQLDTLIAAHAISQRLTLVTRNLKHYSRVRGLKVESWYRC